MNFESAQQGTKMRATTSTTIAIAAGLAVVLMGLSATAVADDGPQTAEEIIEEAVDRNALGFEAGRAQISLTVFDEAGEQRERHLDVRSRRHDEREDESRTVMTLTDPAEVRGQAFLFHQNAEGDDDMWMYVPAFEVTRRVEGEQRRSSFLGTHFTYADLESRDLREADYEMQDDERVGDYDVHVIEATPEDPEESDYEKVVAYIRQDDQIPIRIRFFDRDGDLDKTLYTEQLATTGDDDVTYIERMTLRSESGGYTTVEIQELDPDVDIPDSAFDREELGR